MSIDTYYFEELVKEISDILIFKNKQMYLQPLNLENDRKIIFNLFQEVVINDKKKLSDWNNEDWILSMKSVKLGLFSFMYKNKASLWKVYNLIEDDPIRQFILLEKYKNVINNIKANEQLLKLENYIITENLELDEIEKKKVYLFINFKNFKEPKFLACLLDLLSYKVFRVNILKYISEGLHKIEIEKIINTQSILETNFVEDFIEGLILDGKFEKFITFIMYLNLENDIVVNKRVYNIVQQYITDVIKESDQLNNYLSYLAKSSEDANEVFKSKIKLKIIDEYVNNKNDYKYYSKNDTNKFIELYNESEHLSFKNIPFDKIFHEVFYESKKIKFTKKNLVDRIIHLILYVIEQIVINKQKSTKEKINNIDSFFTLNINKIEKFCSVDDEVKKVIESIQENGIFRKKAEDINEDDVKYYDHQAFIRNQLIKIKNDILNSKLQINKDDFNEVERIIKEFVNILNKLNLIDFSTIEKQEFTIFSDFVKDMIKNKNVLKLIILQLIKRDNFDEILEYVESILFFKLNTTIKEKVIECLLAIITKIIKIITDEETKAVESPPKKNFIEFNTFLAFLGNVVDYLVFYYKKMNGINEDTYKQVKKVVKVFK